MPGTCSAWCPLLVGSTQAGGREGEVGYFRAFRAGPKVCETLM